MWHASSPPPLSLPPPPPLQVQRLLGVLMDMMLMAEQLMAVKAHRASRASKDIVAQLIEVCLCV